MTSPVPTVDDPGHAEYIHSHGEAIRALEPGTQHVFPNGTIVKRLEKDTPGGWRTQPKPRYQVVSPRGKQLTSSSSKAYANAVGFERAAVGEFRHLDQMQGNSRREKGYGAGWKVAKDAVLYFEDAPGLRWVGVGGWKVRVETPSDFSLQRVLDATARLHFGSVEMTARQATRLTRAALRRAQH